MRQRRRERCISAPLRHQSLTDTATFQEIDANISKEKMRLANKGATKDKGKDKEGKEGKIDPEGKPAAAADASGAEDGVEQEEKAQEEKEKAEAVEKEDEKAAAHMKGSSDKPGKGSDAETAKLKDQVKALQSENKALVDEIEALKTKCLGANANKKAETLLNNARKTAKNAVADGKLRTVNGTTHRMDTARSKVQHMAVLSLLRVDLTLMSCLVGQGAGAASGCRR
jgi:hypothetical protein